MTTATVILAIAAYALIGAVVAAVHRETFHSANDGHISAGMAWLVVVPLAATYYATRRLIRAIRRRRDERRIPRATARGPRTGLGTAGRSEP